MVVEVLEPGGQWQTAEYVEHSESTVVGPSMRFYMCGRRVCYGTMRHCVYCITWLCKSRITRPGSGFSSRSRRPCALALRQEGDNNVQRDC